MSKYSRENDNMTFILLILDSFSRFMWTIPLRNKSGPVVAEAFRKFFKKNNLPIRYLNSDNGREYYNKEMNELLKSRKIIHFSTFTETKSSLAERAIRTIKTRLERYFTHSKNHRYIEILPMLTDSYNSTIHSAHGFPPKAVTKENEDIVWRRLYEKYYAEPIGKPKYKIGDQVIVSKLKPLFRKGYTQSYQEEPFYVHEIKKTRPIVYTLKDYS